MKLFEEFKIKNLTLRNRIVMPPMCMYQATSDGFPTLFHKVHYATRALGGVGLIIVESTGVTPGGRITDKDLGVWEDRQILGLKGLVDNSHANGARIALQINHAGRKSTSVSAQPLAPSAIRFDTDSRMPNELTFSQINDIVEAFKAAAVRANAAGFDAIEIHAAHGYLVHEFLSPITNQRNDEYGGSLDNRVRFLREILKGVHSVWPADKLIWVRVSAFDYQQGGIDGDMMVQIINKIKPFIDLVHVSSGGLLPIMVDDYPGYQIPLSERIRKECGKPTITVGLITNEEMAEEILQDGRADLVALGRELLRSPYWPVNVAAEHGISGYVPEPYHRAFRKNKLYETEVLL